MADKILSIGLGANTTGLKKDMDNAAAIVKNAGQQMGDAVSQSADKMSSSSKKAGENLQQAYRAAARDARQAALQFGETSDRFRIAAQTAGELKDRLELTNQTIKAFSSDAPVLSATVGVMHSMAGAFSAAQGAAALFGAEGKALQETMLKVQAAMALTQGLQALTEAGDAFMALKAVIMTNVIPAISSMGTATAIATGGLTLLVAGLAALAVETMGETRKAQEQYIDLTMAEAKAQSTLNAAIQDSVTKQRQLSLLQAEATGDKNILEKEKAKQEYETKVEANRKMYMESQKNVYDTLRYRETLTALNQIYRNNIAAIDAKILEDKQKHNAAMEKENSKTISPIKLAEVRQTQAINIQPDLDVSKIKLPKLDVPKFEVAGEKIDMLKIKMQELGKTMSALAERTFVNFATSLGKALGGEKMDLGNGIKAAIGELCSMLATAAAALGTFYFSIGDVPQGIAAYAASAALGIAAGVLSASSSTSAGVSSSSSSSPSSAGTFGNGGNNNYGVLQVGGQIRGNNLLVSVVRSGYERSRVR